MSRIKAPKKPEIETEEHRQKRYAQLPKDLRAKLRAYGGNPIQPPTDFSGCVCLNLRGSQLPQEEIYDFQESPTHYSNTRATNPSRLT